MNKTRRVRLVFLSLLSALLAVPFLGVTAPSARAADGGLSQAGQRAFQQIASCVAENKTLLASIVVDESGSLQRSDPQRHRASAVTAIVDALAELQQSGGDDVTVEAELALFGEGYSPLVGWGPVTGSHGDKLRPTPDRLGNSAGLTDYREALKGAQKSIDLRARALGKKEPCSVILWFTDGRLDVGQDGADKADDSARDQICKPGGIADSIRASGTHVIALALFSEDKSIPTSERVSKKEKQRLQATVEGSGGATECGTVPMSDSAAVGAYLPATEAVQLRRLFAGAGARIQGATPGGVVDKANGTIEIPVDQALGGFRIVFESNEEAAGAVTLTPPTGIGTYDPISGRGRFPGVKVKASHRDGLYVTTVTADPDSIAGTWKLHAKPGTVEMLDLYYFWGTNLEITAPAGVIPGGAMNTVVIKPMKNGMVDQPGWYRSFQLTTTVDGKTVHATAVGDGTFTVPVDLSTGNKRSAVIVGATAEATTQEHGLKVGPISSNVKLGVGLPRTEPDALQLGRFSQDAIAQGTLTLRGVPEVKSQICFAAAHWNRVPEGVRLSLANDIRGEKGCVALAPDETRTVTFTLTSDAPGDGLIEGHLPATFQRAEDKPIEQPPIPVRASMFRPVNEPVRLNYVALFSAIALAMAWLVAWIARTVTDRYRLGDGLFTASVGVRLTPEGIQRSDGAAGLDSTVLTTDDFEPVAERGRQSQFSARGLRFTRRGPLWWPWRPYRAVAVARNGAVATVKGALDTNVAATALESGRVAPTSFSPTVHAYVSAPSAPEDPEGPINARLVVLAHPDASGSLRARVDAWNDLLRSGSMGGIDWQGIHKALLDSFARPTAVDSQPRSDSPAGPRHASSGRPTSPGVAPAVRSSTPPDFFGSGDSASGPVMGQAPSPGPKGRPKPTNAPATPPRRPDSAAPPDYF